jgi:hypothetical protein
MRKFPNKVKYLFKIWYMLEKLFKIRPLGRYPTNSLRKLYPYILVMLCMLYREQDGSKLSLSLMPLVYYYVDEGSSFNWVDILSKSLKESIRTIKETSQVSFSTFTCPPTYWTWYVCPINIPRWVEPSSQLTLP